MKNNKWDVFRKASLGGSMVAAISASLCCIGPLVAVFLGGSGFAAAGFFSKCRPVLLTATFAFLAVAWFLTYRKPKAACADGSCASTSPFAWGKVTLWIATGFALVAAGFPALSSAGLQAEQSASCCASAGDSDANSVALHPKTFAIETINQNLVSFYRVPFVCPAAPEIGCGSASKPFLLGLERSDAVSEAWLNRTGTIMAIVWSEPSTTEQRAGILKNILMQTGLNLNELTGTARQQELNGFQSWNGWYRGAEVDRLSKEEAGIIAARLVRRVRAKTAVPPEKAEALQRALTEAIKKRLTDDKVKQEQNAMLNSVDGLRQFAGEYLDEEQIPILKEAIANGVRPLPNEK
jgi:hypothetical protein